MPEYLSPGVYVEETDTGNKPIEGVSTSTAGLVGVTERGPANVPTLVTSFADYKRTFGGYLSIGQFTDPGGRAHCYLPHAVEGLFTNGGKRLYITRVTSLSAARADRRMFFDDIAQANPAATVLLRPAEENTGTSINPPLLYVLSSANLSIGDTIRIGDGSRAEYRKIVNAVLAPEVGLSLPLQQSHASGGAVFAGAIATTGGPFSLQGQLNPGATQFILHSTVPADVTALKVPNTAIEIGPATASEFALVVSTVQLNATDVQVTLAAPLQLTHPATDTALIATVPAGTAQHLTGSANGGDAILFLDLVGATFTPGNVVVIDSGNFPAQEIRRIGALALLTPSVPPYEDYPVGSLVEHVTVANDVRVVQAGSTTTSIVLNDASDLTAGEQLVFTTTAPSTGTILAINGTTVTLLAALGSAPGALSNATVQPRQLTAPANQGSMTIQLNARIGLGLDPNNPDVLRIGVAPAYELVTVVQLSDPRAAAPDSGTVVLERPLARTYPATTPVARETVTLDTTRAATTTILDAPTTATQLLVGDGGAYLMNDTIRVTTPDDDVFYHALSAKADTTNGVKPATIEVDVALIRSHTVDSTIVRRQPLFIARALDTGDWGNRVLVTSADEEVGLVGRANLTAATASPGPGIPSTLRLSSVTGVEAGTVLEIRDNTNTTQIGGFVKVKGIDKASNNLVLLDAPGLTPAQVTAFSLAGPNPLVVRSREFRVQVLLQAPPNPAIPIRNDDLLDQEQFRSLSMDPRHSHYFERVIGAVFTDGASVDDLGLPLRRSDRRSEGGSQYLRVQDMGTSETDKERLRLGPEDLIDTLASGLTRPARFKLGEGESAATYGTDGVALMGDEMYTGADNQEPDLRTGIFALENALDISLIACPGQVTPVVQQALIDQCESMLYRFAVLDAQGPADDTIDDITAQRQQFDTKYAAFYHPWLTIPDPFPTNLQSIAQFPIPPSGHMLGIYARVDDARGVYKAPANEVVSGMTGLTRYLNQSEQDLLNAYPTNIDLIRDFRINNRGIRVWGARVITSDSDWKYVPVRRLMIFIEASLNNGLQWVVFEPNDETLWARVRRTVSNFLTSVWRGGALEGTTKDQAFYVKCDRTTMTQDDIDNGRLICLVGVSPVKPAEFVIIRIGLWTADASS